MLAHLNLDGELESEVIDCTVVVGRNATGAGLQLVGCNFQIESFNCNLQTK